MGLVLAGLAVGDLGAGSFVGVGRLDSLEVGLCPGLVLANVRLGDPTMVLGVTGLRTCGGLESIDCSPLRLSYGPAVLGRGGMSGRFLAPGRTGAPDSPPAFGRVAVDGAVEAFDVPDTVRVGRGGEISMADPGRGRDGSIAEPGLAAMAAFLAANIVSRIEGLLVPIVLRENPIPGRTAGSVRLGAFGLCGSFWSSFCAVASNVSIILAHAVSIYHVKERKKKGGGGLITYASARAGQIS